MFTLVVPLMHEIYTLFTVTLALSQNWKQQNISLTVQHSCIIYTVSNKKYKMIVTIFTSISDCPLSIPGASLTADTSCYIPEHCTGVEMCTYIPILDRNIHSYLQIYRCEDHIDIGIEQYSLNVDLSTFEWGKSMFILKFNMLWWNCCSSMDYKVRKPLEEYKLYYS